MANTQKSKGGYSPEDRQTIIDMVAKYPEKSKGLREAATKLRRSYGAVNGYYYGTIVRAANRKQATAKKIHNGATHNGAIHNGAINRIEFAKVVVDAMEVDEKKELLRYIIA